MNVFNINRVSSGFALSYFLKWMIVFGKSRAKGEKLEKNISPDCSGKWDCNLSKRVEIKAKNRCSMICGICRVFP
jgi:hypothetical protein